MKLFNFNLYFQSLLSVLKPNAISLFVAAPKVDCTNEMTWNDSIILGRMSTFSELIVL